MIKMIGFDLDGTIGDTIPMCLQAFKEAISPYTRHRLDNEEIIQTFGLNELGMIRQVVHEQWEDALRDFLATYRRLHGQCPRPFEGIRELLDDLQSSGYSIALITGKGEESCRITLEQFGMSDDFCTIKTGSSEHPNKDRSITEILHDFGLTTNEFLYIGDTVSDVIACRQAGVTCLSAAWANTSELPSLNAANPSRVFHSVWELHDFLTRELSSTEALPDK